MKEISLTDLVELARQSLEQAEPSEWLKAQIEDAKPVNSVANGALDFLRENKFDGLLLLSVLQQTRLSKPFTIHEFSVEPEKHKGLGRRSILGLGVVFLLLVMFLYLKFGMGK
jgi:hypothetical protein